MRSLLDHQADGIEYTLHSHGIEGNVAGGNISPRLIQFHIKLGAGVRYNRVVALADELALALGVTHCRITRDGHLVKIEVPRPDPVAVRLFPLMRNLPGDLPPNSPILGLDENGVPLLLRLDSPDIGHVLISGTTGSGKTILTRSMIASLALQNEPEHLKLLLIDPRGRGYREFAGLPNLVCDIVNDPADGVHRLRWVMRHMDKRDETGINHPLLIIFIDELVDLMMVGGKELEYIIMRLTQRGRDCGIHLVVSTQKPSASAIGAIARSNFPTRIVGRMVSPEDARLGSGQPGSGADKLMGRGDFLLFSQGETSRVQAAHISQEEMLQTVDYLQDRAEAEAQPRRRAVAESRQYYEPRRLQSPRSNRPEPSYYQDETQSRYSSRQDFNRAAQYTDEDYEVNEPTTRRAASRRFESVPANTYTDLPPEKKGVAERFIEYRNSVEQRRYEPPAESYYEPEVEEEETEQLPPEPAPRPLRPVVERPVERERPQPIQPAMPTPAPVERERPVVAPPKAKVAPEPVIDFDEEDIPLPPPPPAPKFTPKKAEPPIPPRPVARKTEPEKPAQKASARDSEVEQPARPTFAARAKEVTPEPAQRPSAPRPNLNINPVRPTSANPLNRANVPPVLKSRPVQPAPRPEIPSRPTQRDLWDEEPEFTPDPEPDYSGDFDYDEDYNEQSRSNSTLNARLSSLPGNLKLVNGRSLLDGLKARNTSDNYKVSS